MSILSDVVELVPATAPVSPSDTAASETLALLILLALAIGGGWLARSVGVFRRDGIAGPPRVPGDRPLWPLVVTLAGAVVIWLGIQTVYVGVRAFEHTRQNAPALRGDVSYGSGDSAVQSEPFGIQDLTAADFAFLATIPGLVALIAILIGDAIVGRGWFGSLGWTLRHLPWGVWTGVVASFIALPVVYLSTYALDWVYRLIEFEHPDAHELLGALESAESDFLRVAMIIGAAIIAPLWEEVAFRGHLQTLLGGGLQKLFGPRRPPAAFPVQSISVPVEALSRPTAMEGQPEAQSPAAAQVIALPEPESSSSSGIGPTVAQRWIAIIITSCLFAGVHEMWTWPAIFVLSVCLGYAYERTGNLWTPIVLHLAFNSISTTIFLLQGV